ncbi:hypothetical protein CYMTET_55172 [Cymbomonas tetramitiformis]|uniref:Uncharacterized protein n=1 Tax=Cymbomonas tetramitiformis TaxID=36881 RepID=A0AAE0ENW4_9CHLO|nr:hypothetical protein CYMTET_55172 [Cymbomonas tetramitiformis]|eukprot:gene121-173_t
MSDQPSANDVYYMKGQIALLRELAGLNKEQAHGEHLPQEDDKARNDHRLDQKVPEETPLESAPKSKTDVRNAETQCVSDVSEKCTQISVIKLCTNKEVDATVAKSDAACQTIAELTPFPKDRASRQPDVSSHADGVSENLCASLVKPRGSSHDRNLSFLLLTKRFAWWRLRSLLAKHLYAAAVALQRDARLGHFGKPNRPETNSKSLLSAMRRAANTTSASFLAWRQQTFSSSHSRNLVSLYMAKWRGVIVASKEKSLRQLALGLRRKEDEQCMLELSNKDLRSTLEKKQADIEALRLELYTYHNVCSELKRRVKISGQCIRNMQKGFEIRCNECDKLLLDMTTVGNAPSVGCLMQSYEDIQNEEHDRQLKDFAHAHLTNNISEDICPIDKLELPIRDDLASGDVHKAKG